MIREGLSQCIKFHLINDKEQFTNKSYQPLVNNQCFCFEVKTQVKFHQNLKALNSLARI